MAKQIRPGALPPDHVSDVIILQFFRSQRGVGEDLYKTLVGPNHGLVLARQELDKRLVRWCTANKWAGGYEASCPLKPGITINVYGPNGTILFSEKTYRTDWNGSGLADKKHAFSWEEVGNQSDAG